MNLSYSKVTTMLSCPRRFYYQYILHLEEEPMAINYGDLGSRAHLVLEEFYRYVNIEANNIEKEFNSILTKLYHKNFRNINDVKGNMAIGIKNFCTREIDRFNSLDDKSLFMPRYSELALECNICGQHFRGRLDAIYTNPDDLKLLPCDYKFTGSNKLDVQHDVQAIIYSEMLKQHLDFAPDRFDFWFLRHGMGPTKRGFLKTININKELELKIFDIIENSIDTIEKGEYLPTMQGSYFCSHFCPFYGACLSDEMGWDD